eukprot:TRINITY_DN284_c0_g2_i2.p1 TRINITY_DN284_c0_g2~~TRINITY_DN284_c0_g2_i2.p1  ORF type:complete len:267 (-),score=34.61 TRINITY_DN284_c0_g2_i2:4-804(-)
MVRKYAFRMTQAASCFLTPVIKPQETETDFKKDREHALRCYLSAYAVYRNKNWGQIDDHLHFVLSRINFLLGRQADALQFMSLLLKHNYQSAKQQASYLREYLHMYKSSTENQEFPLPLINQKSFKIHLHDYFTDTNDADWPAMEGDLLDHQFPDRKVFFALKREGPNNGRRTAVVGEQIVIEVEIKNPLLLDVQFTDMAAIWELSQRQEAEDNENDFIYDPFELVLGPGEAKKVRFCVLPIKQGLASIKGIRFSIFGVEGSRTLR